MSITIAILAKNKEACLPFYLQCLYNQTYPKKNIHLYIRTNDNTDNTCEILENFIKNHGNEYASILYNKEDIDEKLKTYSQHEWNSFRFKLLGKIRQDSIEYAKQMHSDYFVIDCDNFITPNTLESMASLRDACGVIAPMLNTESNYSNYHCEIDKNGYYKHCNEYYTILKREIRGIHIVNVIHCTYFISNKYLDDICYDDASYRYEYVIFSDTLRKKKIMQYLDNREFYGIITFANTKEELTNYLDTHWKQTLIDMF